MTDTDTYTADFVEVTAEEFAEMTRALGKSSSTKMSDWIRDAWAADDHLFTAEEVAEHLRISLRTVLDMLRSGAIEGTRVGRQWRVRRGDLDAFLNKPRRQSEGLRIVYKDSDRNRFVIVGPSGSGKSQLAKELRKQNPGADIQEVQFAAGDDGRAYFNGQAVDA